ncbi:helix-turn-helix transcriptional regulator [bacterium]|nr:helix-turn-helix transcriptional regulator [bacterium]
MNEDEILKKIAFNIKVERMRSKLTQFQLAEMIDVHEKYIGKIESGKQNITIKTLIKLAKALNTSITILVDITR